MLLAATLHAMLMPLLNMRAAIDVARRCHAVYAEFRRCRRRCLIKILLSPLPMFTRACFYLHADSSPFFRAVSYYVMLRCQRLLMF